MLAHWLRAARNDWCQFHYLQGHNEAAVAGRANGPKCARSSLEHTQTTMGASSSPTRLTKGDHSGNASRTRQVNPLQGRAGSSARGFRHIKSLILQLILVNPSPTIVEFKRGAGPGGKFGGWQHTAQTGWLLFRKRHQRSNGTPKSMYKSAQYCAKSWRI